MHRPATTEKNQPIPRVELGNTDLRATRLGLGFGVWPLLLSEEKVREMVQTALDLGIRYFDTAPLYHTESILGRALRDLNVPDDLVIATKACSYRDDLGIDYQEYSGDTIRSSVERSLDRLGLDQLDILHIHDVMPENLTQIFSNDGALNALQDLKKQGAVRSIGMATYHIECLLAAIDSGQFDCIQFFHSYTLLNQEAADLLIPRAQAAGLSTMNVAPQAGYILASGASDGAMYNYRPASSEVVASVRRMEQVCIDKNVVLADVAIAYSLANPAIDVTVIGADTSELLHRSVRCCELDLTNQDFLDFLTAAGKSFPLRDPRNGHPCFAGPWNKRHS